MWRHTTTSAAPRGRGSGGVRRDEVGSGECARASGATWSHSRPYVSNDNPYSEAHFETLEYCPEFPDRFGSYEDGLGFCHRFLGYYNHEHRHSGIGLMTPAAVHHGRTPQIVAARHDTLLAADARHPERFVHHPPSRHDCPRRPG